MSEMPEERSSYGITERESGADAVDSHVNAIRRDGYSIIVPGAVDRTHWSTRFDALLERVQREHGGMARLAAIGERDLVRAALVLDQAFLDLACDLMVLAVCSRLLGDNFVLNQQNALRNPPSGATFSQTGYHRDLPYQHFTSSRPIGISALYCIDEFTIQNGATRVLPASHLHEKFPNAAFVESRERSLIASAGAYIVFDSMLFHAAGVNTTTEPRRAVNHVYTRPFVKQQIVFRSALAGRRFEPAVERLLGYDSDPATSIADWYARREARTLK